jgi:hypothetical protein|uniref:Uncharacterized protein n=1 Tax=Sipha flava TaxID=143950 RepID=A0A2S2QKF3_9HEMI
MPYNITQFLCNGDKFSFFKNLNYQQQFTKTKQIDKQSLQSLFKIIIIKTIQRRYIEFADSVFFAQGGTVKRNYHKNKNKICTYEKRRKIANLSKYVCKHSKK